MCNLKKLPKNQTVVHPNNTEQKLLLKLKKFCRINQKLQYANYTDKLCLNFSIGTIHTLLHQDLNLYLYRLTACKNGCLLIFQKDWNSVTRPQKFDNNLDFASMIIFCDKYWRYILGYMTNSQNTKIKNKFLFGKL